MQEQLQDSAARAEERPRADVDDLIFFGDLQLIISDR